MPRSKTTEAARSGTIGARFRRGRPSGARAAHSLLAVAFLLPALAVLAVFRVWPMFQAFYLSFTRWDGIGQPEWIGLKNYSYLLEDPVFRDALVHNLLLLLALPVWVILPFVLAAAISERVPGWRFFRVALFLPALLSPVIVGIFFSIILRENGAFNDILRAIGLGGIARGWLTDPQTALVAVGAILVWATIGVGVMVFLSALSAVDREQIEAARIDGASWWQTQRHIVFWQIVPVIEFWSVIVLITAFTSLFPYVYTLTNGGPGYATYILDFAIYQEAFGGDASLGYASAMGVVLFVIVLVLSLIQMSLFRRKGTA